MADIHSHLSQLYSINTQPYKRLPIGHEPNIGGLTAQVLLGVPHQNSLAT